MILAPVLVFLLLLAARYWGAVLLLSYLPAAQVAAMERALVVAMVLCAAVLADGLVRRFYWHGYWRRHRGRETPALIRDLLTFALLLLALSFGLWWVEGFSFTGFVTASGATAIILGIALQTVIQDLFSGLSINLDASYALGDWLTVYADHLPESTAYGQVTAMTWRSTFLTLQDGRLLMVPNHLLTANPALNHSRPRAPKRMSVEIPLDSRIPSGQVLDLLQGEALKAVRAPGLSATPAPYVHIERVTSDTTAYHVYFYADPHQVSPETARGILLAALLEAVQKNALPMPVTQIELTQPPDLSFAMGEQQMAAALCDATLFRSALDAQQRAALAGRCSLRDFRRGEVLMHQGGETASMFIILEGAARVTVRREAEDHEVAVLARGDVVGEMSLMTGAPRTASVTALTGLKALEITKDAVAPLLESAPDLLPRFSQILALRQQELDALANRPAAQGQRSSDLLGRMKIFFGHVLG